MDTVKSAGAGLWKVRSANAIRCVTDGFVWGEDGQIGVERQEWPRLKGRVLFQRLGYSFNFQGRDADWEQRLCKTSAAPSCLPAWSLLLQGIWGCLFCMYDHSSASLHFQPSSCPLLEALGSVLPPYTASLQMDFFSKRNTIVYHWNK